MYIDEWLELIQGVQPAVGQPFTRRIPGETYEGVKVLAGTFAASAVVGNRFIVAEILDADGTPLLRIPSSTAVPAGATVRFYFASDIGAVIVSSTNDQVMPFPDMLFPPGLTIRLNAVAIDAGDQFSLVKAYVRRVPSAKWAPSGGATPYRS